MLPFRKFNDPVIGLVHEVAGTVQYVPFFLGKCDVLAHPKRLDIIVAFQALHHILFQDDILKVPVM